jgi:hypothetical protein
VLRLGQLIGVPIGVAAIVAALAAVHAQSTGPTRSMGLRSAVAEDEDPARPAARERERQTRGFEPIGSGAGSTGFDSTNLRRRKAAASSRARTKSKSPPPQPALPQVVGVETTDSVTPNTPPRPARPGQRPQRPGLAGAITPAPISVVRRRLPPEDDPFAPVGIRAGAFVLKPAIEVMGGYDSNASRSNIPRGSSVLTVSPELKVQSDWLRHELTADIRGTYSAYEAIPSLDRPQLDAKVNGRIDASRQTRYDLEGRLRVGTDNPGSPDLRADVARLPIYTTVGGTAGVAHRFNRLEVALKGTIDRTDYQESKLTDGTRVSNDTRNYTQYGTALRGSYDLLPGVKPFVEVGADTRLHDSEFDAFGVQRDSRGMIAKAGTTFELSRKLTGEASVGYLNRTYDDPRLQDLRGLIVDASLIWTATALTTVRLNAKSVADESTLIGVSGVLRRDATLEVEHAFRRWLIGTGRFGFGQDEYVGSDREDNRMVASAALTYKMTRTAQVKGEFRQEWLRSSVPGNDYTASIIMVGLRLQR